MTTKTIKKYRFGKARNLLQTLFSWYKKEGKTLPEKKREELVEDMKGLDAALLAKDRSKVNELATKLDDFSSKHTKKSIFSYALEIIVALAIALIIATVVRQVWFEPHEIPTGSMRPTYKEEDKLVVSKTAYGINIPFTTKHAYFDPSLVKRTNVFTFSADNIPMQDADGSYFGIFPYKKRLIKRVMGLPGDTLYFYGGKIYGIDSEGKLIKDYQEAPWLAGLEYIPFLSFKGGAYLNEPNSLILKQMNIPLGRITFGPLGTMSGQIHTQGQWIKDNPYEARIPHTNVKTYGDFWGFKNFAMVQLLKKNQLPKKVANEIKEDAELYLELRHNPSLTFPSPVIAAAPNGQDIIIPGFRSFIPLKSRHLNSLMDGLYTARFVVEGGKVHRYAAEGNPGFLMQMSVEGIPDGTYEFYNGKAYSISWGGVATELPVTHPLYNRSVDRIQNLFNFGIDFSSIQAPSPTQFYLPHRYAYFRDGDLYTMGSIIMTKDDPILQKFIESEKDKQAKATPENPYLPFIDYGPPNEETIKAAGVKIPAKHYLALGDNHAMSGDSRVWGFVPEDNVQGAPSFVIWPYGPRQGLVNSEPPRPWLTLPNILIGLLGWGTLIGLCIWHFLKKRRPVLPPDFH